jgi:two-component system response regulator
MEEKVILLIEDNQDDIALTLRAFNKCNIKNKVNIIEDGQEALDFVACKGAYEGKDPYDLPTVVLLDINLPKVNGFEILKAIRENEATKCLPVVILTSSKEEQDIINGYTLGANSYIRKPVDFKNFFEAVQALGLYWLIINEPPKTSNKYENRKA